MAGTVPRKLRVEVLARIEGEAGLDVAVKRDGRVEAHLAVFEPPRLFEGFLRGRDFREAPDLTARICGICPVAYQTSACQAMERACGVTVDGAVRDLRRLLYFGEWIESHALHVHLLHGPDFLGYESGIHMAADHPEPVVRGLRLKKVGNDLMTLLGGREIHPVGMRVGGFWRAPRLEAMRAMREPLLRAIDDAVEAARWTGTLDIPEFERDYLFLALRHDDEYAIVDGRLATNNGFDADVDAFERHVVEVHAPHSNALQSTFDGQAFLTGPLARFALSRELLSPRAKEAARELGLNGPCMNPFRSIHVRAVETIHAAEEALAIVERFEPIERAYVDVEPREGSGCGASEAPRGLLYHRYRIDAGGSILEARIVPPTAQNQKSMEEDLVRWVGAHPELDDERLGWTCEQAVRNHDPCISCATHFLRVRVTRE
jgi:coenzyme F420-reducing hydrogenase alpha subunit